MSAQVWNAPQPNCDAVLQQTCAQMNVECQQKMMEMLCEGEERGEEEEGEEG